MIPSKSDDMVLFVKLAKHDGFLGAGPDALARELISVFPW